MIADKKIQMITDGLYKDITYKIMRDQVYYYVRGTKYKLVLLVNFGTPKVEIKRLIYTI